MTLVGASRALHIPFFVVNKRINGTSTRSFNALGLCNTVTPTYEKTLHYLRGTVQTEFSAVDEF